MSYNNNNYDYESGTGRSYPSSYPTSSVPSQQQSSNDYTNYYTPPANQYTSNNNIDNNAYNANSWDSGARTRPSHTSHQSSQSGLPQDFLSNPVAGMVLSYSKDHFGKNLGGFLVFLSALRYYFHVSNGYVLRKLKILLFPFLHKNWKREQLDIQTIDNSDPNALNAPVVYRLPKDDINAPDLYIPTMSFITLTLLMGYALGTANQFHPEVLGLIASRTLVTLLLEVLCLKGGFYLIASHTSPPMLDLVSYASYKYVNLIVVLLIGICFGSFFFYTFLLIFGAFSGLFMMRVMKRVCTPIIDSGLTDPGSSSRRNSFLVVIGVMQIIISWFLIRNAIASPTVTVGV